MRYAMPVDPSLLEKDFESAQEISLIPNILINLEAIYTPEQYKFLDNKFNFTKTLSKLWFYINKKTGINLRDREKLYPIFKQLSRIFGTKEYNTLYRGVRLPKGPFENLLTEMTVGTGDPDLRVLTILENLAYGLRSWTSKKDIAIQGWGVRPGETRDVVIFKIHNPDIVLDTNQFTRVIQQDFGIFDLHEVIIYLKDPEVVDIEVLNPGVYLITVVDKG